MVLDLGKDELMPEQSTNIYVKWSECVSVWVNKFICSQNDSECSRVYNYGMMYLMLLIRTNFQETTAEGANWLQSEIYFAVNELILGIDVHSRRPVLQFCIGNNCHSEIY